MNRINVKGREKKLLEIRLQEKKTMHCRESGEALRRDIKRLKREYRALARKRLFEEVKPAMPILVLLFISVAIGSFLLMRLPQVGLAPGLPELIVRENYSYSDEVNLRMDESGEYTWEMAGVGLLNSVKLDGSTSKDFVGRVYLEYDGRDYLVLDRGQSEITGFAVLEDSFSGNTGNEGSANNELDNISVNSDKTKRENATFEDVKEIEITVGGSGSRSIEELFTFNISAGFNWDIRYDKLCTKWDIDEISLCYGASGCCALIGLESRGIWNDTLYLSYGRYGAGLNNTINSQLIYTDYSLDIEAPYSDIIYSDVSSSQANFYQSRIEFNDACIETCILPGFNATSYKLKVVVESGSLEIGHIKYIISREFAVSRNAPVLLGDFDNITIYKNEEEEIDLTKYFRDDDGDELAYSYISNNLSVRIKGALASLRPEVDFTGRRYMFFTASDGYYNVTSNMFYVDIIERPAKLEEVNVSEILVKPKVVINRPVRWVKSVNVSGSVINLSVNISGDALNVSVRDVKEGRMIKEDKIKVNDNGVVKNASAYRAEKRVEQIGRIENKLLSEKSEIITEDPTETGEITSINKELLLLKNERNKLTGYAVGVRQKGILTLFFEWLFNTDITSYAIVQDSNETVNATSIIIEEIVEEVEIEYYTEGPVSGEEDIANGKRIIISSEVHYEDILAYTYLDDVPLSSIRLYRIVNDTREKAEFASFDENNNSLIDYIEWIVPSLSNETYEIIIITKAEHLDENRAFISDIYEDVRELDGNWSEPIPPQHYIRVTFERNLTKGRDITLYARTLDNSSAKIEVYSENNDTLLVIFENISLENWYKVYLSNLSENEGYDVFDLRIMNASIEFDYIVDPVAGCDPENGICTDMCGGIFVSNPVGWTSGVDSCYSSNNYLYSDISCDIPLVPGDFNSDCASYVNSGVGYIYYCPSYQRKGSIVGEEDCICSGPGCPGSGYNSIFDFQYFW